MFTELFNKLTPRRLQHANERRPETLADVKARLSQRLGELEARRHCHLPNLNANHLMALPRVHDLFVEIQRQNDIDIEDEDDDMDFEEECDHEHFPSPSSHHVCHHRKIEEEKAPLTMDVFDDETLKVRVAIIELPGVTDNLSVNLELDELTISGSRKDPFESVKGDIVVNEIEWGPFFASFPAPVGTQADSIKATLRQGLLTITVPLVNDFNRPKPIPVLTVEDPVAVSAFIDASEKDITQKDTSEKDISEKDISEKDTSETIASEKDASTQAV